MIQFLANSDATVFKRMKMRTPGVLDGIPRQEIFSWERCQLRAVSSYSPRNSSDIEILSELLAHSVQFNCGADVRGDRAVREYVRNFGQALRR